MNTYYTQFQLSRENKMHLNRQLILSAVKVMRRQNHIRIAALVGLTGIVLTSTTLNGGESDHARDKRERKF